MSKREIKNFLEVREKNEGFTKFIVIKKVDGKPVPVWIETGATDFNNVEVLSGLKLNEEIYVVPSDGLIKNQDEFKNMLNRRRPI